MSEDGKELYYKVIWQDEQNINQLRLVINEFRGVEYLHIRKYYLDFCGDWHPSNQGVCIPLEIESSAELFRGAAEILSLAESREVIEEYFGDLIRTIYNNS